MRKKEALHDAFRKFISLFCFSLFFPVARGSFVLKMFSFSFFSFRLVLCAVQYQVQNVIYFSCLVLLYRYQSIPSWSFVSYFSLLSCSQLVPRYLYTLYLHHEINMKDYLYKSFMMLIDDFHFNIFMFNCSIQRFCFRFWVNRNSI